MVQVKADKARRLLRLDFLQHVDAKDMKRFSDTIQNLMRELPDGFRLLSDLSRLESMDNACIPYIERYMDLFRDKGIAEIIRVIPDPQKDIGFSILSIFHYSSQVRIVTCETLAEAEELLK